MMYIGDVFMRSTGTRLAIQITFAIIIVMIGFGVLNTYQRKSKATKRLLDKEERTLQQLSLIMGKLIYIVDKRQMQNVARSYLKDPDILAVKTQENEVELVYWGKDPKTQELRDFLTGEAVPPDYVNAMTLPNQIIFEGEDLGILEVTFSRQFINDQVRNTVVELSINLCLVIIIASVVIMTLSRKNITIPLLNLVQATQQVVQGNWDHAVPADYKDELGVLAKAFNMMRNTIRKQIDDLNTINTELQHEILERKHAEENLAKERNLLRTLVDSIPDPILVKDCEGKLLVVNSTVVQAFGATKPDELLGKTDFELFPEAKATQYYAEERPVIKSGQALINQEHDYLDPNTGLKGWVLTTKVPFRDAQGQVTGLVVVNRDVTKLKQVQEELQHLNEELEDRVKQRTAELACANAEIQELNEKLKEENLRLSAELDVARRLQQMILPKAEELRHIEGVDIVGFMQPADEVGGDYYDVLRHNGTIKIGIGDVTGHGLESGVLMLMTQTAVRTLLFSGESDPRRFLGILNRVIYENIRRMQADKSLTLSMIDYQEGQIKLSGQHEQMIVIRQGGKIELVDTIDLGFPIGLDEHIDEYFDEEIVALHPGDGVVLYSDGVTEAENLEDEQYGLERLCEVISRHWVGTAEEIKNAVVKDVTTFIGTQKVYDDLTLVVLKQQ